MSTAYRQSPVAFDRDAAETINGDGWGIVLAYEGEGDGPWLVDLSHLRRWDFQHGDLDLQAPFGLSMPTEPGQAILQGDKLVTRMNYSQSMITCLTTGETLNPRGSAAFTEMTEAHCMLAVIGKDAPFVMEHVSNLDLFKPSRRMPFLTQGPIMRIPSQVVTLDFDCVLMTFSRGYGQSFAHSMLHAASGCGLGPGGANVFTKWLSQG